MSLTSCTGDKAADAADQQAQCHSVPGAFPLLLVVCKQCMVKNATAQCASVQLRYTVLLSTYRKIHNMHVLWLSAPFLVSLLSPYCHRDSVAPAVPALAAPHTAL
jgi:hypothetical protein